jgi:hypothetical protein
MLDKLDKIDWSKLQTGYKRTQATHVPFYIRQLLSSDSEARKEAHRHLTTALCEMYMYGTATPVSIPFLLEILQHESSQDKYYILWMLQTMLQYSEVSNDLDIDNPHVQLDLQIGRAVSRGLDIYIKLLDHEESETRSAAGHLLFHWERFLPKDEHKIKAAFRRFKAREKHPRVKRAIENWFELGLYGNEGQEFPGDSEDLTS